MQAIVISLLESISGEEDWYPNWETILTEHGMLQAQQQLQPQVRAQAWGCGGSVTNMKAIGAQQWLTELPPQFVFPAKQRLVSHQFQSQLNQHLLNQRLCETQSAMASHAWNVCPPLPLSPRADHDGARDILKFENGPALDHVDGFAAVEDGFRTSGPHQNPWDVVPSHIPSHQPDHASGLHSDHDVVSTSSTLQSSLVSHSGNSIHDTADIWSFLFENQAFMNAHPPSSSGPTQISQDQCSEVAVSSNIPSPYSPSFGTQTGNITSYNKAWMESPSAAPQNPYNHSWELVNQVNQYSQAFDPPQPGLATKYHGLPFKPVASAPDPQPPTETEAAKKSSLKSPWFDDVTPRWPDYATIGMSFSSDSEIASPVSPKSRGVERAMLDKKSFWSSRLSSTDSTNAIPMPMLTHSQASPASDWNDLSSSHPGEQKAPTIESNVGCPQRTLRSHTQNCLATVPPQTMTMTAMVDDDDEEWPASPQHKNSGKKSRKDDLLVQWKKAGMSYRQIREKGGFTEAESTLRGRYRTLTKRREERVRKPLWTQTDVSSHALSWKND